MRLLRSNLILATVLLMSAVPLSVASAQNSSNGNANLLDESKWPEFVAAQHLEVSDEDDVITKLLKERFNAAQQELRNRYKYWLQNSESLPLVMDAAERVIKARIEAGGSRSEKVVVLAEQLDFAKLVEKQSKLLSEKYRSSRHNSDEYTATYFRAHAEIELTRARASKKD